MMTHCEICEALVKEIDLVTVIDDETGDMQEMCWECFKSENIDE